jgi:hypothetical protein
VPTDSLTAIPGDPGEVMAAGRRLASIAAEVAATASQLRAAANANSATVSWTGQAAIRASARTVTLPPKLDKVHASYATASLALTNYANALAETQRDGTQASRDAASAEADLTAARAAQEAAAARDRETAATAAAAGQPAPPPMAPRYNTAIDNATHQLARAKAAQIAALDGQQAAARRAAVTLEQASHLGIANKHWWQHAIADVGHWAGAAWTDSLRFISTSATAISALAGIAGLVLAVAGIFFPPLEVAAAACETVALVAGIVGATSDVLLAASGNGSWTAVAWDAVSLGPWAAAKATTKLTPLIRETKAAKSVARSFEPSTVVHASHASMHDEIGAADLAGVLGPPRSETWANSRTLPQHFRDHASDFGAETPEEYANLASEFLVTSQLRGLPTKISPGGTIRAYDPASNTFGSFTAEGKTRTFFKPTSTGYWARQDGRLIEDLMKP